MTDPANEDGTLAHHLTQLAASADDLSAFLSQEHHGDIHPEALAKSEHLSTSLKEVIHALTEHEHLAMSADDVWKMLTVKHNESHPGGAIT
ncbi:MAG: hypothetical protein R2710_00355 [Acidimicrobiales bacterium]